MNLVETIYCSQYYELKKSGRDFSKGRTNATVFIAAMITLVIISAIVLVARTWPYGAMAHFFKSAGMSGRSLGKLLGLVGLAVIGGLIHFTVGSKSNYEKMIARWEQMPEEELAGTNKKALMTFGVVFLLFLGVMITAFM